MSYICIFPTQVAPSAKCLLIWNSLEASTFFETTLPLLVPMDAAAASALIDKVCVYGCWLIFTGMNEVQKNFYCYVAKIQKNVTVLNPNLLQRWGTWSTTHVRLSNTYLIISFKSSVGMWSIAIVKKRTKSDNRWHGYDS